MTIELSADEPLVIHTAGGTFVGRIVGPSHYPGEWVFTPVTEGEAMPKRTAEGVRELIKVWQETIDSGKAKVAALEEELAILESPPPPPNSWLTVEVKFHLSPNWYRYLILHVQGKGYFTTGTMEENKFFATWEELLRYFNKEDVQKRSPFSNLDFGGKAYGGYITREPL